MNKFFQLCLFSLLMHTPSMVSADGACCGVPQQCGYFFGLGASYNTVKFEQNYSATGNGDVYDETETLVATGEAGGPAAPLSQTLDTLAPVVQVGYTDFFRCSNNFWGLKFVYQYLDLTSIDKLLDTPQAGFLDPVAEEMDESFTGNVITKSAQSKITHRLDFLAFFGTCVRDYKIYLGIGPSLFDAETDIYQAFGFANREGLPREATGVPVSFSTSDWIWGGTLQLGVSYFLNSCWFFDFNYSYSISQTFENHFSSPFTTSLVGGYTIIGTLFVDTKTKIRAQNLSFTVNRKF